MEILKKAFAVFRAFALSNILPWMSAANPGQFSASPPEFLIMDVIATETN